MSNRNYPRDIPGKWSLGRNRPGIERCDGCGGVVNRDEPIYVVETQVNCMRGDDEVNAYCVECAAKRGQHPPMPKAERKAQSYRDQIGHIDKKIANHEKGIVALRANREKLVKLLESSAQTPVASGGGQ